MTTWLKNNSGLLMRLALALAILAMTWPLCSGIRDVVFRDPVSVLPWSMVQNSVLIKPTSVPVPVKQTRKKGFLAPSEAQVIQPDPSEQIKALINGRVALYYGQLIGCVLIFGLLLLGLYSLSKGDL